MQVTVLLWALVSHSVKGNENMLHRSAWECGCLIALTQLANSKPRVRCCDIQVSTLLFPPPLTCCDFLPFSFLNFLWITMMHRISTLGSNNWRDSCCEQQDHLQHPGQDILLLSFSLRNSQVWIRTPRFKSHLWFVNSLVPLSLIFLIWKMEMKMHSKGF